MSLPRPRDWEENDGDAEASHQPQLLAKRPRCSSCCDDEQKQQLEEMRNMLQKQNEKLESMYRENQDLREKVSCLTADISRLDGYLKLSPAPRTLSDQHCSVPLRLKFMNACKNDKYSTRKIEADDGTLLKVAIYDHHNKIVTREPFSSIRVQIVPIHGDFDNDHRGQWTEEYFRSKIVTGRSGKEHLLYGDLFIRLQEGVGYLNSAKFQDNSSFVASKRFKLGVMSADETISERIQEGITESFAVKDVRGYSTKKNLNPSPRDAVYKLNRIAMNGDRHKLLERNSIKTVEDFLFSYKRSPEDLRKILGKISDQEWDTIIKHAHKCNQRLGIYASCIQERNVSHEHERFSRSDGTCYLQGSCSVQPCLTPQIKQLDIQVAHQLISSTYNGQSSCASLENMPGETENVQAAAQQLQPVENALEAYTSPQGRSSKCNITLDGNVLPCSEDSELDHDLAYLSAFLLDEQDTSWEHVLTEDSDWGGSNSACDQIGGHSSASEAGNWSHTELSPTRPTRLPFHARSKGAARRRRCRRPSTPPLGGAGSIIPNGLPVIWGRDEFATDDEE